MFPDRVDMHSKDSYMYLFIDVLFMSNYALKSGKILFAPQKCYYTDKVEFHNMRFIALTFIQTADLCNMISLILNDNKSLNPLRAKKTFIRKKLGHTAVSAIKASPLTL